MQQTPISEEQAGEVFERFGTIPFFQTLSGILGLSFLSNGLPAIPLPKRDGNQLAHVSLPIFLLRKSFVGNGAQRGTPSLENEIIVKRFARNKLRDRVHAAWIDFNLDRLATTAERQLRSQTDRFERGISDLSTLGQKSESLQRGSRRREG
jgi:hypothetical protein